MGGAGIYCINNITNGHCYVGGSIHVARRLREHKSLLSQGIHFNVHLQRAWNKYGRDAFELTPILSCNKDMVTWYEQQFLDQWKPEYNLSPTAGNIYGYRHSEEARRNMSISAKKKPPVSDETKRKLSSATKGQRNPFWGKTLSKEHKQKIRQSRLGYVWSVESKGKLSKFMRHEGNPSSKLTEDQVKEIRSMRGIVSGVELAKKFGITKTTVSDIQLGKTWRIYS